MSIYRPFIPPTVLCRAGHNPQIRYIRLWISYYLIGRLPSTHTPSTLLQATLLSYMQTAQTTLSIWILGSAGVWVAIGHESHPPTYLYTNPHTGHLLGLSCHHFPALFNKSFPPPPPRSMQIVISVPTAVAAETDQIGSYQSAYYISSTVRYMPVHVLYYLIELTTSLHFNPASPDTYLPIDGGYSTKLFD